MYTNRRSNLRILRLRILLLNYASINIIELIRIRKGQNRNKYNIIIKFICSVNNILLCYFLFDF